MNTPEQAFISGISNPIGRVLLLFGGSYAIAIFYPLPDTLYYMIRGPVISGGWTWTHDPVFVDFTVIPFLSALFSKTVLASGPISLFCVLCSVLDRWSTIKTTILGGYSTFFVYLLNDGSWRYDMNWFWQTVVYSLLIALLIAFFHLTSFGLSSSNAEQDAAANP